MLKRKEIIKILKQARKIDSEYEMFGASKHKYSLNPPIRESFVRGIEEKYGFKLPEDYFRFITEIGDGGAGPDYGIDSFVEFLKQGKDSTVEKYRELYRYSLAKDFTPRQMRADEVEEYAIATREAYERNPNWYIVFEQPDDDDLCDTNGFFVLGTHGCQWDFGIIISGEKRGKIFDTDNEGAYGFVANSFDAFYQNWLNRISDTEGYRKELENWRNLFNSRRM